MRDAGQYDRVEVLEDSLERFRFVRGPRRQPRSNLARTHAAEHRMGLRVSQVLFDPAPDPSKVILDNGLLFHDGVVRREPRRNRHEVPYVSE